MFRVFETAGGWAWRFLKRPEAEDALDLEIQLLPALGGALSLPVPRYEHVSDPALPPRFVGYRKIQGVPFDSGRRMVSRSDRPVRQLAQFLAELHRFPVGRALALGLPPDAGSSDGRHARWLDWSAQVRRHVWPLLDRRQRIWAERTLMNLLNDTCLFEYTPALVHGDLWAEHVLFDPASEALTGVIDWESAHIGDPAADWAALWLDHGDGLLEQLLRLVPALQRIEFERRVRRWASHVPLNEILCGVLYADVGCWQAGWQRIALLFD